MKVELNRLRYRGTFNQRKSVELDNGNWIYQDYPLFNFRYGYYKQSLSQSVSTNAFDYLKDKVTIVVRHNDKYVEALNDSSYSITLMKPNNKTFTIASINPDYDMQGFDTIVLSAVGGSASNESH